MAQLKAFSAENLTTRDLVAGARVLEKFTNDISRRLVEGLMSAIMTGKSNEFCDGFMEAGDLVHSLFKLTPDDMAGIPPETIARLNALKANNKKESNNE